MDMMEVDYEIDFLPVGDGEKSGDAIAIRFGNIRKYPYDQRVIIIDGGFSENGEKLVEHINKYYGTNEVNIVISTHPDNDHISGLIYVLENMDVEYLLMHRPWEFTDNISRLFEDSRVTDESVKRALKESLDMARALESIAIKRGVKIINPFTGISAYDGLIEILGPSKEFYISLLPGYQGTPEPKSGLIEQIAVGVKKGLEAVVETLGFETLTDDGETSCENNSSVITLLTINRKAMLFTGDAGIPALNNAIELLESKGFDFSTISFIQVPHHGSYRNIGPSILNKIVGPKQSDNRVIKTAFVSASIEGAPKHPSKRVTNAFLRRGAPVHATCGVSKCHFSGELGRGWSSSIPLPFFNTFEE